MSFLLSCKLFWVSRQGDVGLAMTPTVYEVYEVHGVVRSAGIVPTPVSGAKVTALYNEKVLGTSVTDSQGEFIVRTFRAEDAPPEWLEKLPLEGTTTASTLTLAGGAASPMVVKHNVAAVQRHKHWGARIVVEADGFEGRKVIAEVPRNMSAAPIAVELRVKSKATE